MRDVLDDFTAEFGALNGGPIGSIAWQDAAGRQMARAPDVVRSVLYGARMVPSLAMTCHDMP